MIRLQGVMIRLFPNHSDITKYFDTIKVEYNWAPLAIDQFDILKEYRYTDASKPDMIIIGGGAWDRLHVWATDEDQGSLKATVAKLMQELEKLKQSGVPIIWVIPTTINTRALNQEEKRKQMSESAVNQMRELYISLGIVEASTFVIDGRRFTEQRVQESFDGIHYPLKVYEAAVQILANSMDWIFLQPSYVEGSESIMFGHAPPKPGMLANSILGLIMLCFILIGLFFFDGYVGFTYLGSLIMDGIMPNDLYEEAFIPLHQRWKLPMGSFWSGRNINGKRDTLLHGQNDLELTEEFHSR